MTHHVRHLGRKLTDAQQGALTFALSEGEVLVGAMPARQYTGGKQRRVTQSTINSLVARQLLIPLSRTNYKHFDNPQSYGLTHWGHDLASAIYFKYYGEHHRFGRSRSAGGV